MDKEMYAWRSLFSYVFLNDLFLSTSSAPPVSDAVLFGAHKVKLGVLNLGLTAGIACKNCNCCSVHRTGTMK